MPTLPEVPAYFPKQPLVLHLKSDEQKDGEELARYLSRLPQERQKRLAVYRSVAAVAERLPQLRVSKATIKKVCLLI
jgi:glycerophosphoryl diester phosphodiesterase